MKKLLCFFRGYRKETVLAPLFKLAEVLLELIVPLVVATIIDKGIGEGLGTAYILRRCLFLLLLGASGLGFTLVAQYFSAKAASGVAAEIRKSLFRKMESLSYSAVDSLGESTMIARITGDVDQLQTGINLTLRLFLPFALRRPRRYDHGVYGGYKIGARVCRGDPAADACRVRNSFSYIAALPEGARRS